MTFSAFSFSETPFSGAKAAYSLSCSAGSYTLSGQPATFAYTKAVLGNAGAYTITGGAASFDYDQVLTAEGGSYSITGNSASFAYNQVIYAGAFSYLWTGNDVSLLQGKIVNGGAGAYAITGGSATFAKGKAFAVNAGSYALTGQDAELTYTPIPVVIVESKGGLPGKKRKTKIDTDREQREELEAIVKREFDILDGTYQPEVVEKVKDVVIPKIKQIDLNEYNIAIAQVNALLLQAKIQAAEYESELDDEEALLMLL